MKLDSMKKLIIFARALQFYGIILIVMCVSLGYVYTLKCTFILANFKALREMHVSTVN